MNILGALAVFAIVAVLIGWQPLLFGIGVVTIVISLLILEILNILKKIPGLSVLSGHISKGHAVLAVIVLVVLTYGGISLAGITSGGGAGPLTVPSLTQPPTLPSAPGALQSATLRLNVKSVNGTYNGASTVFGLPAGIVSDRNALMKKVYEGKTSDLTPGIMSLTSGQFSLSGFNAKIGDTVTFAGYQDNTPAATENISFVKTATITGMTAGSTPEWMLSDSNYVWYNYPTLAFYDATDTQRSGYNESEGSAIEKTFTFNVFPGYWGDTFKDTYLWVEIPESNVAAIKKVKITASDGTVVEYGMPQSVTSSENIFKAVPSLTTSTDKIYNIGKLPVDSVRINNNEKAKQIVEVTYDHPASSFVLAYFKITTNTNALTSAGGHYDSPSTNLRLNMTDNTTAGVTLDTWW